MKFKPNSDFILVSDITVKQPYSDKIIIPGTAKQRLYTATVKEVGQGANYKGKVISPTLKVGDKVIYGKDVGEDFEVDGEKCKIMKEGDVFGIWTGYVND